MSIVDLSIISWALGRLCRIQIYKLLTFRPWAEFHKHQTEQPQKLKQPEATSETIAVLSVQENFHNNIDLTFRTDIVDYKMSLSKYAGMAGTWSMDLTGSAPNTESAFSLETTEESVFDPDYRSLADVNDYMDGGKYRGNHVSSSLSFPRQLGIIS